MFYITHTLRVIVIYLQNDLTASAIYRNFMSSEEIGFDKLSFQESTNKSGLS
jgi:hypothetical protein